MSKKFSIKHIIEDFPILEVKIYDKQLIYLDSAATAQRPSTVINAVNNFYKNSNANIHRATHNLASRATEEFEKARAKVANFINAEPEEIIFTSGTTESLNLLAKSLSKDLKKDDEIVLTEMEHHSNLVPWQQIAKENGPLLKFISTNPNGTLNLADAKKKVTKKTRIISVVHTSNVLGTVNDVPSLAKLAKSVNALLVIDGAQSIAHQPIDVKELNCDFFAFSGHKMLGPSGIGVLYGKKKLLEKLEPAKFGGGMISEVTFKDSKWGELPWKFEAGTPNLEGAIGLGAAVDYLNKCGMHDVESYLDELTSYALTQLSKIKGLEIYGPKTKRGPIISFNLKGIHPHDASAILDKEGIAIRGGHMCAMPLVTEVLNQKAVCRVSFQIYNTKEDVDKLVEGLKKVGEVFKK